MLPSPLFKKALSRQNLSHQDLIASLQSLNHVIFIQNDQQPLVGFLAQDYLLCQQKQYQFFQQTEFNHYQAHSLHSSIDDFLDTTAQQQQPGLTMGFISYDFAAEQHITLKQEKEQPSLFLGHFPHYLSFENDGWYFNSFTTDAALIYTHINHLINQTTNTTPLSLTDYCRPRWSKTEYRQAFHRVQSYIQAGDCYQINLTQEFNTRAQGTLLSSADDFWQLTAAPYAGYLRIADFELLSCSPELFIDFKAQGQIVTKPIKGTMPRYRDAKLDQQAKLTLQHSKKDQAENVMIVDLLRNDFSVYAETGSVKTPKLFNIESFNQVHHMVSEVSATLKAEINPFKMLISALPGGSITGAPKIRAMQIIDELEMAPRGAYCGSMGYLSHEGIGSWNILIRSIQKYQDQLSLWAGGGITIASQCDAEYQECFDKVSALLDLLQEFQNTTSDQE
ncbi:MULTISPECIES: anthranilate synthase component I family protein [unclassified Acinetobacter]|uniref:anthranilate synthase component I family protein n=1 Tax=unclassified Acinetobacter TaxID=196816 RepID=UPI00293520F1|nr:MULTISPECIES: anthranilate synthase component I family protein [unclassified Acinetobacter]WOE31327.1 anthranilate synthase component I family protein [Acinetobacter sp. SAAs470]WOE39523.1 anthranilate synthase component I family protein [Acinetobacter sp. SAAs474]